MRNNENNILDSLLPEQFRIVRRRMIESILATDMSNHQKTLNNLKGKLETFDVIEGKNLDKLIFNDNVGKTYENQQSILNMIIHTADISNCAKPPAINRMWVDLLFTEYFAQGDEEKSMGLNVSLLCDRITTDINKSQIGFINLIALPTFETVLRVIPEINEYCKAIKENLSRYEELVN